MKPIIILLGCTLAGLTIVNRGYAGTEYTNRAAFQAALLGFTIEEFEDEPLVGSSGSGAQAFLSFDDFSLSTVPPAGKILNVPAFGAVNSTPGGSKYLYLDTDIGFSGLTATFTFSQPQSAFGFDYSSNFEPGNVLSVIIDGQVFNIAGSQPNQPRFWGYIDDIGQNFATGAIVGQTVQSALGVDRVTYGGVPIAEPSGPALILAAMACFAIRRARQTL